MIATLRESKAKLSEFVERAAGGEEVLITVRGRPKARLIAAHVVKASQNMAAWSQELEAIQSAQCPSATTGQSVLEDLRGDRW